MFAVLLFFVIAGLCVYGFKRLTKDMFEDYAFMLSQAEPRDHKQKLSDKIGTAYGGNVFTRQMVNVSMLHHNENNSDNSDHN